MAWPVMSCQVVEAARQRRPLLPNAQVQEVVSGGVAVERDADVLEMKDFVGRLPAHDLDCELICQVVRALDRVEGVRLQLSWDSGLH